jgi:hypothetical protein
MVVIGDERVCGRRSAFSKTGRRVLGVPGYLEFRITLSILTSHVYLSVDEWSLGLSNAHGQ